MDIAKLRVAAQRAEGGANRAQKAAEMEAQENLRNELKEGKREMDNIFLLANAPSYTDDYGQFNQDTGNRAIDQSSPEAFLKTIREAGAMPQTDAGRGMLADELRRMRLASIPKPLSPKEEAELNKILLDNRKTELELSDLETPKETYKPGPDIMSNNIKRANDIMDNDGIIPATSFGGLLKAVPGTDAHKLGNLLQTIKGNIGFDYLQKMRQDSPTGGALGQVSNQELSTLQSVFGSLEQTQKAEDLKYNLKLLNHVYNNIIHGEGKHDIPHPDVGDNSQSQTPQVDPSAPASQATLDELERKRQLRSKRAGL